MSTQQALIFDHGFISTNYKEEVEQWTDVDYYEQHVKRIQLPYSVPISTPLTPDQQREKRKELARKLVEINARKREEKVRLQFFMLRNYQYRGYSDLYALYS